MKFAMTFRDPDHSRDTEPKAATKLIADKLAAKFIEWDEYVTIEFDTESQSARVVPVAELQR